MAQCDIALIGLAVMGQNLVLNMNDHGFRVCVFNRTVTKVTEFINNEAKGTQVVGATSLEDMVSMLVKPRKVILLVQAGVAVDNFISQLLHLLEPSDIIIDGGNSDYKDSVRRCKELESKGIFFVGSGVSGGEEGARKGPSLMPGGNINAWPSIKPIFQAIAAKVDNGVPCCDWVGSSGAGHYVKMVHNGIEYGDMQLIAEAYHIMKSLCALSNEEMSEVFHNWNSGVLESFLIEITSDILAYKEDGVYLVDKIMDSAGQKGTGKWTAIGALDAGVPVTLIAEAVFARCLSSCKSERVTASTVLPRPLAPQDELNRVALLKDIEKALYASKIVSYAQGFMMMRQASHENHWDLNLGAIALMWRGGCIIRSAFLGNIKLAFDKNVDLANLLLDDFFRNAMVECQDAWRRVVSTVVMYGIPTPAFSSALAFYDGYATAVLPANLIQAQRDYFGAHQYEILDKPGHFVHTNWTGRGGTTASTTYKA